MIALATAALVGIVGAGEGFWLCVPGVLMASASYRTRAGAAVSAVAVTAAATAALAVTHARALPAPLLALLVLGASVIVLIMVRERLERERDTLRDFALSDPLTGIANRRSLLARGEYEIARHLRSRRSFAVVMVDLDGFKLLNDRFGHTAGDDLLREIATALEQAMRAQDTVARIGGDEFCVLAPETDEFGTHRLADRITQAVGNVTAGVQNITASIGIAIYPHDGTTAPALIDAADQQLLGAKRDRGRGRGQRRAA